MLNLIIATPVISIRKVGRSQKVSSSARSIAIAVAWQRRAGRPCGAWAGSEWWHFDYKGWQDHEPLAIDFDQI